MPLSRCLTSQISLFLTLFAKIKFSRKSPDLQYTKGEQQSECPHIVVSSMESRFDLTLFQPVFIRNIRSQRLQALLTVSYVIFSVATVCENCNMKCIEWWFCCCRFVVYRFCRLHFYCCSHCLWVFVFEPCFVMQYPMYVLVLRSCR